MGMNLNLDLNKLPHIWQTLIAMVAGGVIISAAVIGVSSKLSQENKARFETELKTKQAVESLQTTVEGVVSTQDEILRSIASQEANRAYNEEVMIREIQANRNRLEYYMRHQKDMTVEQIIEAWDIGYANGVTDGKKKEMIP
jgi:LPS O-antigen subunit length determinant protein (WzzB/FepE family)